MRGVCKGCWSELKHPAGSAHLQLLTIESESIRARAAKAVTIAFLKPTALNTASTKVQPKVRSEDTWILLNRLFHMF